VEQKRSRVDELHERIKESPSSDLILEQMQLYTDLMRNRRHT
jgi:hypothetical protein